jgi:polysaccharide chain length determinant protein (PEP-CTERM system associated)
MGEVFSQLIDVLRGIWQGRWVGVAVAWLTGVAAGTVLFLLPDRYEASARVYVDTQSILKPLLSGLTVQPNVEQEVQILSRTLISRPNVQKLVRMTDMDLKLTTQEERERLVDELTRTLSIKSAGRDNLYTIGFVDPDPGQATRVVQSLLSIFVESGLSAKSNDTGQAKRFIEEQIKVYEQRLSEAENRMKEFKLKHLELNPSDGKDYISSMSKVSEDLRDARLELEEALRSRDTLKRQLADEDERPPSLLPGADASSPAAATPEIDARIATLNKSLDEMLLKYTEAHPDVINARRVMKELEEQRDAERKRIGEELEKRKRAGGASAASASGTYYPQLKLALAEAEAQVSRLQARVADYEKRAATLRDKARSVPEIEAMLAQLNRDYAVQKLNYDQLVARRESATISGQLEAKTGVADFRVIDPPRVSPTPVAPNRKMLALLALLASLGAGLGASYLFSVLHPTLRDTRTLKRLSQRPVLGSVSLIANAAVLARRRRSRLAFYGALSGLAATYAGVALAVLLRATLHGF